MLTLSQSAKFNQDVKRVARRGKDIVKIINVIVELINETPLPPIYGDHPLKGDLEGFRDCHIESDWILIYEIRSKTLYLSRTGTHTDIFGK
jgi:mRNA interferase YafQ